MILSAYPGVWGANPGESGVLPNALSPGDMRGFPYVDMVGERGVGS